MPAKDWNQLTAREQLDGLTKVLTDAGINVATRDRCFVSSDSAKEAIADIGGIQVPNEFKVQFLTQEEAKKMLIFIMPDFHNQPAAGGPVAAPRRKAEDYLPCSYSTWAATKPPPGP